MPLIDPLLGSNLHAQTGTKALGGMSELKSEYDFIVCGAGSSGSVVASRLSEDPAVSVLLIEAGSSDEVHEVSNPLLWAANLGAERDWGFLSEPDANLSNRQLLMSMGKVLGGGSGINVMIWARGHRTDWNHFAEEADDDAWSYESVTNIYRRIENWRGKEDFRFRGTGGPVWVQPPVDPSPLALTLLSAAEALGIPRFESQNGLMTEGDGGCSLVDMIVRDGQRHSIFKAYIRPWLDRSNLTVLANSDVQRLVLDGKTASGIEVRTNGEIRSFRARFEVVVSLGAINTPKLLMLSGIGDEQELKRHDLPVVQHLPGVGKNLQDHVTFPCSWSLKEPLLPHNNGAEATIYWNTEPACEAPEILICQAEFPYKNSEMSGRALPEHGWTMVAGLARPKSRGEIRLRSANPDDMPVLNMNFFSHPDDMELALKGIELCRRLGNASAFSRFGSVEAIPGDLDEKQMAKYIRDVASTFHHQSCSAKMGTDAMSVVDGKLRVYGIENLRIADASVLPRITTGNTMAPSVIIGEIAASQSKLRIDANAMAVAARAPSR